MSSGRFGRRRGNCLVSSSARRAGNAQAALAADCTGQLTKSSACAVSAGGDVNIGGAGCERVFADQSLEFRTITVGAGGALCVRDADVTSLPGGSLDLAAERIVVDGTFQVGSADSAIGSGRPANHVRIRFTGAVPEVDDSKVVPNMNAPCPDADFRKGLQVCKGGVLRLFGARGAAAAGSQRRDASGKVSWTYLSQPAGDPCRFGRNSGAGSPIGGSANILTLTIPATMRGSSIWPTRWTGWQATGSLSRPRASVRSRPNFLELKRLTTRGRC